MKEKLIAFCHSLGLDTIGMISCRKFVELEQFYEERKEKKVENEFEEENIEKRINPIHYMKDGKTIISIAFPYYNGENAVDNGFSIYTKRMDYHRVVNQYLAKICTFIKGMGGKAVHFVDSNALPERYLAYLAGVGFIGRNNMIITEKYGSYVFLGEIITNLDLQCQDMRNFEEIKDYKECGTCRRCRMQCPTKSINDYRINPNICLSYITQKKDISEKEISLLKGNVFGCDICQLGCPYNEKAEKSKIEEFAELEYMAEDVKNFAAMDNKYFKEKVSKTSCGWRGKNVIRRNAIIHLAQKGKEITQYKGDSPYINQYIDILKQQNKSQEGKKEDI